MVKDGGSRPLATQSPWLQFVFRELHELAGLQSLILNNGTQFQLGQHSTVWLKYWFGVVGAVNLVPNTNAATSNLVAI